ncbi:hypothetical protein Bbelb_090710 [Branchiostoma belcheri]|nr:hypothetical protein Bbelb_090710 [Branchiostoma belcheri]
MNLTSVTFSLYISPLEGAIYPWMGGAGLVRHCSGARSNESDQRRAPENDRTRLRKRNVLSSPQGLGSTPGRPCHDVMDAGAGWELVCLTTCATLTGPSHSSEGKLLRYGAPIMDGTDAGIRFVAP